MIIIKWVPNLTSVYESSLQKLAINGVMNYFFRILPNNDYRKLLKFIAQKKKICCTAVRKSPGLYIFRHMASHYSGDESNSCYCLTTQRVELEVSAVHHYPPTTSSQLSLSGHSRRPEPEPESRNLQSPPENWRKYWGSTGSHRLSDADDSGLLKWAGPTGELPSIYQSFPSCWNDNKHLINEVLELNMFIVPRNVLWDFIGHFV